MPPAATATIRKRARTILAAHAGARSGQERVLRYLRTGAAERPPSPSTRLQARLTAEREAFAVVLAEIERDTDD